MENRLKILYGIQSTGNGHLSRALELVPCLQKFSDLDLLVSGTEGNIVLPFPVKFRYHGLSFVFGQKGGIDYVSSFRLFKPTKLMREILACPVEKYDLIISDFEPVTAWASRLKGQHCISVSHQAAFRSNLSPRPDQKCNWPEWVMRLYAPAEDFIGLHFQEYDQFIRFPIIRSDIRALQCEEKDHVVVYLPSFSDHMLAGHFKRIKEIRWKIYSKRSRFSQYDSNVEILPFGGSDWQESLRTSAGVLIGAGFEGPSEALYFGKKLFVIPMKDQYEQLCNAAALEKMGVRVGYSISQDFSGDLKSWLTTDKPLKVDYPDHTELIVRDILKRA